MSKIKDLIPDDRNYNNGNEFGNSLIEKSLRKLGAGRSILIDKNNRIIAGNKTVENAVAIGLEDMQIVESDGTKIIAVKRTDIDLDTKKGRELALADNASAKANIVWNHENLKEDWGDDELKGWGIEEMSFGHKNKEIEEIDNAVAKNWRPDIVYKSDNEMEIPLLKTNNENAALHAPFMAFGASSRSLQGVGTYHFYVDDYRFAAIWDNPNSVIDSGCVSIVEPNLSLYDTTPVAYGLSLIYKKRWFARFCQDYGIDIYVDLNVNRKFADYNLLGVPKGWRHFATRGYAGRLEDLQFELDTARQIADGADLEMIIYGGGSAVAAWARSNGCIYIEQFMCE